MRFYDREQEIKTLRDIRRASEHAAQFTVVTGRRRIGKTMLILKAYEDQPILYFFVSRKAEAALCADFCAQIEEALGVPMLGTVSKFVDIFEYLMRLSHQRSFTLVIDEFRRFLQRNIRAYRRPDLPVHFVGGITATYQEELKQALEMEGLHMGKILSRPIQGMVEYHLACKK